MLFSLFSWENRTLTIEIYDMRWGGGWCSWWSGERWASSTWGKDVKRDDTQALLRCKKKGKKREDIQETIEIVEQVLLSSSPPAKTSGEKQFLLVKEQEKKSGKKGRWETRDVKSQMERRKGDKEDKTMSLLPPLLLLMVLRDGTSPHPPLTKSSHECHRHHQMGYSLLVPVNLMLGGCEDRTQWERMAWFFNSKKWHLFLFSTPPSVLHDSLSLHKIKSESKMIRAANGWGRKSVKEESYIRTSIIIINIRGNQNSKGKEEMRWGMGFDSFLFPSLSFCIYIKVVRGAIGKRGMGTKR